MKDLHASAERRLEGRDALRAGQMFLVDLISDKPALSTHGIVLNISRGGMAVQTFYPLVQGRVAEIRLAFPKASSSSMGSGLVAWEIPGGLAGIRFLNAPLKNLLEVRELILENSSLWDSSSALPLFSYRRNSSTNEIDTTLHLFACNAMALTGATGAAVALGNSSGMECRASIGNAPDVGARILPDIGLSGHSLRTGAVNLCDDACVDSRVNAGAAQQIGARSILIVPITTGEYVVGVLEVFSGETNHFDGRHLRQLLPIVNALATTPKLETVPRKTAAANSDATVTSEEPTQIAAEPQSAKRHRAIAIALGIVTALLAVIVTLAFFGSWLRIKSQQHGNSPVSIQSDARQLNADVAGQSAEWNAKPEIDFNPPAINEKVGAAFGVDVVLKGAKDLLSVPVEIFYDPEKLELIDVTNGGLMDRDGQAAVLTQRAAPLEGRIYVSVSRPSSAPGISGNGVVFTLKFLSKASGRSSLRVSQAGLRETSAKILSVDSSEAIVTISTESEALPR
jgi:hypothetical protein